MRVGKNRFEAYSGSQFGDAFVEMLCSGQITPQSMAVKRCPRLDFCGGFVVFPRFVNATEPLECVGVVVVPIALVRAKTKRFRKMFCRLVDLVLNEQHTAKVGMRFGVFGIEAESDVEFPNSILFLAGILQSYSIFFMLAAADRKILHQPGSALCFRSRSADLANAERAQRHNENCHPL